MIGVLPKIPTAWRVGSGLRLSVTPRVAAVGVIFAFAVFNLVYLLVDCPLGLAPDEAHYWDWSRRPLQLSYYSKGPLVAWLIRGSCEVFGNTMPAIRLPAVIANVLLLLALYRLTALTFRREWLAFAAVVLAVSLPAIAAPAVVMTIDGPYLACWAWACVFALKATHGGSRWCWLMAGAVAAVGLLAKYTMLLFPLGVGFYLLTDSVRRIELKSSGFWLMVAVAGLGGLPLLIWNMTHEWIGFRHVLALAGGDESTPSIEIDAVPHFLTGQFGLLIGYWFITWICAAVAMRPRQGQDSRITFLWWLSVPVWAVFAIIAAKSKGQPNWPAPAYVTGFILAVGWLALQLDSPVKWYRRMVLGFLIAFVGLGSFASLVTRYPGLVRPTIAKVVDPPSKTNPTPVRKLDPTSRLTGWDQLAREVDHIRAQVRAEENREPVLAGMVWTMPGELAFYCENHPEVFTFGLALADRHSQYDLWRPNPISDAQEFRGRTFVYVGDEIPDLKQWFDRAELPVEVTASDGNIPVAHWKVWVLRGFRGVPADLKRRRAAGY